MKNNDKIKLFIRFLKEWKVFYIYTICVNNDMTNNWKEEDPRWYLSKAFVFSNTEQGYNFWAELHFEWTKYYEKYKHVESIHKILKRI